MSPPERFSQLVQTFFTDYLVQQRDVSPRTLSAYRDAFRLLLPFLQGKCGVPLHQLNLLHWTASNLVSFLKFLEDERGNGVRTRNCRLAALRSFSRYVGAVEGPEAMAQIQRVMTIPNERFARPLMGFLSAVEMQAILDSTGKSWTGQRDHLLFLFLYNTGARVSEALAGRVRDVQRYDCQAVQLLGKGRKQRMVPLWRESTRTIREWIKHSSCYGKLSITRKTGSSSARPKRVTAAPSSTPSSNAAAVAASIHWRTCATSSPGCLLPPIGKSRT